MEDKSQKEPEKLSEEEIQKLKDRWTKPENIKLLKKVFIGDDELERIRYIDDETQIPKCIEWFQKIGKIFSSSTDFDISYIRTQEFLFEYFKKIDVDDTYLPILDLRGCESKFFGRKFSGNIMELFLPYADLSYSLLNKVDCSQSFFFKAKFLNTNLNRSIFSKSEFREADLSHITYSDGAVFDNSHFFKAKFFNANLEGITCNDSDMGECDFTDAILKNSTFLGTNFDESSFYRTNLQKTNLKNASLANIKWHGPLKCHRRQIINSFDQEFSIKRWKKLLKFITKHKSLDRFFKWKILPEFKYQDTPIIGKTRISGADFANSEHFERYIKDEQFGQELIENCKDDWKMFLLIKLWAITCDCGRSIFRWLIWSLFFALSFGIFYNLIGPCSFDLEKTSNNWSWYAPYYYSIVTFTTLGFGDITPKITLWGLQMIVTLEVILGYIMLGGLISIFANKLARRAS